jgi:penicillin-binding protein 1B
MSNVRALSARRLKELWRRRYVRLATAVVAALLVVVAGVFVYYYIAFARLIDASLHGERERVLPRVFGRPLELRRGQFLTESLLVDRLNELGYTQRDTVDKPGEFVLRDDAIDVLPRDGGSKGRTVRVLFRIPSPPKKASTKKPTALPPADHIARLEIGGVPGDQVALDAPLLTSVVTGEREKRREVALSVIPKQLVQAVLAIEDRRFYDHPGIDPIGIGGALFSYASGRRSYLAGGSTITQQLVRNVFLPTFQGMTLRTARLRSIKRKVLEAFVSIVLTRRASKDDILEMYLNDIPLGQRGSFAIVGVSEASRLFFAKDVSNVSLAEAATIAGVIQLPSALSPFSNPARCLERRNVVLDAMVDADYITPAAADRAKRQPLGIVQRALESEAPYFVDLVGQTLAENYPGLTTKTDRPIDVYTTLSLELQRLAQDAVRTGLTRVDKLLSRRRRNGSAEAALIAIDPRTNEILALVGGRSYNQSQYNRAIVSRRQPGSVFKPFVFLTAFEQAVADGRTNVTPASMANDEPETFEVGGQVWTPENYENDYEGPITFRRALAHSRNLATIHVAEGAGYENVAKLWQKLGVGNPPKAYPSIALGVFEATPYEIATAYSLFPNGGIIRPLKHLLKVTSGDTDVTKEPSGTARRVARADTTYLVTNMMRSVINEGTGAGARAAGFTLDAAGKTGTTNDLRDAWFVGFTPELLTVVWVGFDDNQPLGLSGAQAALPIWTEFMQRALAGHSSVPFKVPEGVSFVDIDPDTGQLAGPACPRTFREAFLVGTEPTETCEAHK